MFTRLLLTGALALSSGCSLVLVHGPPDYVPAEDPVPPGSCTMERTLPAVDAAGAAIAVIVALTSSEGRDVRIGAAAGGALGFSAYRGFRKVGSCRSRMPEVLVGPPSPDTTWTLFPKDPVFPGSEKLEALEKRN